MERDEPLQVLSVRVSALLARQLDRLAAKARLDRADYLRLLLEDAVRRAGVPLPPS